jgi:hypothetical protein
VSTPERIDTGPLVDQTYDRMVEIMGLITGTQAASPVIEYSALMCAAATLMTVSQGMEPTMENCRRVMCLMAETVIPAIEAEVEAMA